MSILERYNHLREIDPRNIDAFFEIFEEDSKNKSYLISKFYPFFQYVFQQEGYKRIKLINEIAKRYYNNNPFFEDLYQLLYIQMNYAYSIGDYSRVVALINKFDKDKDGSITAKELVNVIESLFGQRPSMDEISAMIKEVDLNADGKIGLDEFMTLMEKNSPDTQTEEEVINAFRVFDKEGNGLIATAELKHIMMTIGDKMTEEEADEMIHEADIDDDGVINYEEFVRMMMAK